MSWYSILPDSLKVTECRVGTLLRALLFILFVKEFLCSWNLVLLECLAIFLYWSSTKLSHILGVPSKGIVPYIRKNSMSYVKSICRDNVTDSSLCTAYLKNTHLRKSISFKQDIIDVGFYFKTQKVFCIFENLKT